MPWFTKKERRRQVSAFQAIFKGRFRPFPACFGRFPAYFGRIGRRPIWPDMADTARFWPNQPGSARIEADSTQIEPHRRESSRVGANPRKKKKRRRGLTHGQRRRAASNAGAAPLVSRPFFLAHIFKWITPFKSLFFFLNVFSLIHLNIHIVTTFINTSLPNTGGGCTCNQGDSNESLTLFLFFSFF